VITFHVTATPLVCRGRALRTLLLVATSVVCAASLSTARAEAFDSLYCGTNGTYIQPGGYCPANPDPHTWTYNEAWTSVANNNWSQPFYELVYHGHDTNGEVLSNRVHYGNGYVDSAADLTGSVATWMKRAYATNASVWANTTLWAYAHTA
jgi:hypothetical protein